MLQKSAKQRVAAAGTRFFAVGRLTVLKSSAKFRQSAIFDGYIHKSRWLFSFKQLHKTKKLRYNPHQTKEATPMSTIGAIVCLTREGEEATLLAPLGVSTYLGHLVSSLKQAGVTRFFVACHEADAAAGEHYFPAGTPFATTGTEDVPQRLSDFLTNVEQVIAVTAPVYLSDAACRALTDEATLPQGVRPIRSSGVVRGEQAVLLAALERGEDIFAALEREGETLPLLNDYDTRPVSLKDAFQYPHPHEGYARANLLARHAKNGVRILCPENTFVSPETKIGSGTTLLPGTILRGETVIGANCEIGPHTTITNCTIGDGCTINQTQTVDSKLGNSCTIGPFAYIRPGCVLADKVKVGDFAELKNSTVGRGTKIPHLTYVGDSDIGAGCNFGCGSITVNYDGQSKERCVVEDNAFVGCNTNLVAPVRIGTGAYIAAGSTVTNDVPADSLAIARARQEVKKDWVKKKKKS